MCDFQVLKIQTKFQAEGISKRTISLEDQKQLLQEGKEVAEINFEGSQLEKRLLDYGAKAVTLPMLTPTTLLAAEKAEAIAKRGLSFAELSRTEAGHMERLLAGEIQWAMQKMFRQYAAIADLLLPTELIPKEKSTVIKEEAKAKAQPQLNFGE